MARERWSSKKIILLLALPKRKINQRIDTQKRLAKITSTKFSQWFNENNLEFNAMKTHTVSIVNTEIINVNLDEQILTVEEPAPFLGLLLHSRIS